MILKSIQENIDGFLVLSGLIIVCLAMACITWDCSYQRSVKLEEIQIRAEHGLAIPDTLSIERGVLKTQ